MFHRTVVFPQFSPLHTIRPPYYAVLIDYSVVTDCSGYQIALSIKANPTFKFNSIQFNSIQFNHGTNFYHLYF